MEQERQLKLVHLLHRVHEHLLIEDIKLLLLDHEFNVTDDELERLLAQVARDKKNRKTSRINNNIESHRASMLLSAAKQRASAKGERCTLTREWVVDRLSKGVCERTGIPFVLTNYVPSDTGGSDDSNGNPFAPSIDRRDNTKGYTLENSQMVLIAYNKFKSDYDEQIVLNIAKALVEHATQTATVVE
jgi:hypothetical protein